jgi:hypothetical protein
MKGDQPLHHENVPINPCENRILEDVNNHENTTEFREHGQNGCRIAISMEPSQNIPCPKILKRR